MIDTLNPQKT